MKLAIRCVNCISSFDMESFEVEEGGNIALYRCPRCYTLYVAWNVTKYKLPMLFKLTRTKSFVMETTDVDKTDDVQVFEKPDTERLRHDEGSADKRD